MHVSMEERFLQALRTVVEPNYGVNIVDLGLVYAVGVLPCGDIYVQMTMPRPVSPLSAGPVDEAEAAVRRAFPAARARLRPAQSFGSEASYNRLDAGSVTSTSYAPKDAAR